MEMLPQESALTDAFAVVDDPDSLLSLIDVDFDSDPWLAVSVTVCDVVTADTLATKLAVVAPEGTVTEAGTLIALLLLSSPTIPCLPFAAELNVTVQVSDPGPVIVAFAQLRLESDPFLPPEPCSLIMLDRSVVVLLVAFTL